MERTPIARPPDEPARGSSLLPIALAVVLFGAVCVVLIFLTVGFFGSILVMAGGLFGFAALHYVVWGWWLGKVIRDEVATEEAEDDSSSRPRPARRDD
jgi:hypothetical protein